LQSASRAPSHAVHQTCRGVSPVTGGDRYQSSMGGVREKRLAHVIRHKISLLRHVSGPFAAARAFAGWMLFITRGSTGSDASAVGGGLAELEKSPG
jgi:hypothetical protein